MCSLPLISVIDDDDSVRESLRALIRSAGLAVQVFASAEEFMDSQYFHATNCVILDVRMPGMNGLDLQRRLTVDQPELPVIFITAHGDQAARSQALKAGAVEYLLKPFSDEALLTAINTSLASKYVKVKV